jgi:hypothetical protein
MAVDPLRPVITDRDRREMMLQIGELDARTAAEETAGLPDIGSAHSVLEQQPLQADAERVEFPGRGIERHPPDAAVPHQEIQVILEVLAHARNIGDDRNIARAVQRRRASGSAAS